MKTFLEITVVKSNINSKKLFNVVHEMVMSYIDDGSMHWDNTDWRTSIEAIVDEHFELLVNETKNIESWKIVCNDRNNPTSEMAKNLYTLDVFYRQSNCLNLTHLSYKIKWYVISKKPTPDYEIFSNW